MSGRFRRSSSPRTSGSIADAVFGSDRCHIRYTTTRSKIFKFPEGSYNEWDWCFVADMEHVEY